VKQFHFTAWPDHGVPTQAGPILAFRRKVRAHDVSHAGVMVIHCRYLVCFYLQILGDCQWTCNSSHCCVCCACVARG
jgi:hypothetical protein